MLKLKEANMADAEKEWQYVAALPEDENGFTNDYPGVEEERFCKEVLPFLIDMAEGKNLQENWVPMTTYFLWNDDEIVGMFRLRQYLNDWLRHYHGHIGMGIKKECRGRGYATEGLRLVIEKARDIIPEDEIYMSVHKDNPASLKAQLHNGAYIAREDDTCFYTRIKL